MPGRVVFIGAGPGSADLITVRGARRLAEADVVLHDALVDPALRDLAPRATWIDVGKRGYAKATAQTRINALLVQQAQRHACVVRLKGGDPSLFARLEEELQALDAAGIPFEVVPGVTAALAAAAATARPLTRRARGRSVAFATAVAADAPQDASGPSTAPTPAPGNPAHGAARADTEVYYMAGQQLAALGRRLQGQGWPADTPVSVVSRAGWPDQLASTQPLADLAAAGLLHRGRPTVVVVGVGAEPLSPSARPAAASPATAPAASRPPGLDADQASIQTPQN